MGLKPKTPQHAAGILIDPPPSLACAIGTSRAATAAADPPLEPPGVRSSAQGLCVGPNRRGSVVGRMPNSGVFVLPRTISPACSNRATSSLCSEGTYSPRKPLPSVIRTPAYSARRSLRRNGTPANGPWPTGRAAASRARSNIGVTTALRDGLSRSIRAMAASTSSIGRTSQRRTRSACAVASSVVKSSMRSEAGYRAKRPGAKASRATFALPVRMRSAMARPMAGPNTMPFRPAPVAM